MTFLQQYSPIGEEKSFIKEISISDPREGKGQECN
jgi:hypothetical protein